MRVRESAPQTERYNEVVDAFECLGGITTGTKVVYVRVRAQNAIGSGQYCGNKPEGAGGRCWGDQLQITLTA